MNDREMGVKYREGEFIIGKRSASKGSRMKYREEV